MVARSRRPYKIFPPGWAAEKISEFGEVEVSQNDTVIFESLHASKTLLNCTLWKKTDGSVLTWTSVGNVATVTSAVTNQDCIYMVYGYKP
jgi:hypothetical protein